MDSTTPRSRKPPSLNPSSILSSSRPSSPTLPPYSPSISTPAPLPTSPLLLPSNSPLSVMTSSTPSCPGSTLTSPPATSPSVSLPALTPNTPTGNRLSFTSRTCSPSKTARRFHATCRSSPTPRTAVTWISTFSMTSRPMMLHDLQPASAHTTCAKHGVYA